MDATPITPLPSRCIQVKWAPRSSAGRHRKVSKLGQIRSVLLDQPPFQIVAGRLEQLGDVEVVAIEIGLGDTTLALLEVGELCDVETRDARRWLEILERGPHGRVR